ncbi:MAG: DUF4173 domain-containing protein [Pseudomonadota bacterium]
MKQQPVLNGVPRSLQTDAWWLADSAVQADGACPPISGSRDRAGAGGSRSGLLLVSLIAAGDVLFFGRDPGVSLTAFSLLLVAAVWSQCRDDQELPAVAFLWMVTVLPVVEYVQVLSVIFLGLGTIVACLWLRLGPDAQWRDVAALTARWPIRIPVAAARGLWGLLRSGCGFAGVLRDRRLLRHWAFPLGGSLVFLALLLQANPVLDAWLAALLQVEPDVPGLARRLVLWTGLGLIIWPFLTGPAAQLRHGAATGRSTPPVIFGLNRQSALHSLILFNLVLGIQTGLDARFLLADGSLPDGMSYAEYAHRGAYPLLATALLAGAFALIAQSYVVECRIMRWLAAIWIGQNLVLSGSAMARLWLYVDVYGLTYLRLHAAIWMAVVAIGLAMIGWQGWQGRSGGWLTGRICLLGLAPLYVCCFINFAEIIARHNLKHGVFDGDYLCDLGSTAAAALAPGAEALGCAIAPPQIEGWRDWGFRKWRVSRKFHFAYPAESLHENPRG